MSATDGGGEVRTPATAHGATRDTEEVRTEHAEAYRAAARAAVAELDEIESVAMSLEARLVGLRTRARSLGSLLDAIHDVVPDAAARPGAFTPAPPVGAVTADLPRRRRLRERRAVMGGLDDLPVRIGGAGTAPTADDLARAGLLPPDAATRPPFEPVPAEVEAWG